MQRSIIQDTRGSFLMRSTSVRPSLLSSTVDLNETQNRIINLPNHRKVNLAEKLDFLVVFQFIEIERLDNDNETLRVRCKELQRQLFTFANHQVQIRELMEKCQNEENMRKNAEMQLDKSDRICRDFYTQLEEMKEAYSKIDPYLQVKYERQYQRAEDFLLEIERLKQKNHSMQLSFQKEIQSIRETMESQRRSAISRQMSQLTLKHRAQLQNIQGQLNRSREQVLNKANEIKYFTLQISKLHIQCQEMESQAKKVGELQNKIQSISQQNRRLNEKDETWSEQCQTLRFNINKLMKQLEEASYAEEQMKLNENKLANKEEQLRQQRIKCASFEEEVAKYLLDIEGYKEYQIALENYQQERNQLHNLLQERMNDENQYKNQIAKLNAQVQETKFNMQQMMEMEKAKQIQKQMEIMEEKFDKSERMKVQQIQSLRAKIQDKDKQLSRLHDLEHQNKEMAEQMAKYVYDHRQLTDRLQSMEQNVRQFQQLSNVLREQRLIKDKILQQRSKLNDNIGHLTEQIRTLKSANQSLEHQLQNYAQVSDMYSRMDKEIHQQTFFLDELQNQISTRIKQLNELSRKYMSMHQKYTRYEESNTSMLAQLDKSIQQQNELTNISKQVERLQNDNLQFTFQVNELKTRNNEMLIEKESLMRLVDQRNEEIKKYQRQMQRIEKQMRRMQENQESKKRELLQKNNEITKLQGELRQVQKDNQRKIKDMSEEMRRQQEIIRKIKEELQEARIPPQVQALVREIKEQSDEQEYDIREHQERIIANSKQIGVIKEYINKLYSIGRSYTQSLAEMDSQLSCIGKMADKLEESSKEISKLTEENLILESKYNMMAVEFQITKGKKNYGFNQPEQTIGNNYNFSKPQYKASNYLQNNKFQFLNSPTKGDITPLQRLNQKNIQRKSTANNERFSEKKQYQRGSNNHFSSQVPFSQSIVVSSPYSNQRPSPVTTTTVNMNSLMSNNTNVPFNQPRLLSPQPTSNSYAYQAPTSPINSFKQRAYEADSNYYPNSTSTAQSSQFINYPTEQYGERPRFISNSNYGHNISESIVSPVMPHNMHVKKTELFERPLQFRQNNFREYMEEWEQPNNAQQLLSPKKKPEGMNVTRNKFPSISKRNN